MDRWKREGLRSANNGLRNQVEQLVDSYEEQQSRLTEIHRELETLRLQAGSSDGSVGATVDANGVLTDLSLTPAALRRTPDELARSIVQATQEAARQARERSEKAAAPVAAALDDEPDLTDILGEGPTLRDIREFFRGP
ncbi:DNA-binding protein YbaB [Nocardia transvalensis]|uniref:DNA-binding protein YbaB n=1 Tax=Nocardia transvalensis TaxID=37333 RepID=A0A7W9UND5_9NOCA|nr:YbaB/EbfC family nucleoid-associated protein [Nocardia transvalensis]MBB5918720.1 DNA-binding protein YbaB [Nocardia transvalensis]